MEYLTNILKDPQNILWVSTIGSIASLFGFILAFYFYNLSKKIKAPYCITTSHNIIKESISSIDKLQIKYEDNDVINLTLTTVVFWNAGKETINRNDIVRMEPLQVGVGDNYSILNVKKTFEKNNANEIDHELSPDRKFFNINFEYMDQNEGVIYEVLHTGKTDKDVKICGLIKGAKPIKRNSILSINIFPKPFDKIIMSDLKQTIAFSFIFAGIVFIISNFVDKSYFNWLIVANSYIVFVVDMLLALVFIGIGLYLYKTTIPKGFISITDKG
jgi:hypothetical protein